VAFNKKIFSALLTCGVALTGCETTTPPNALKFKTPMSSLKSNKKVSPAVAHAMELLEQEKFHEASQFINQALQGEPKSVALHLLNAMTYEKLSEVGDATGSELASVGYTSAVNLDPSNYFAVIQLGKLKYREQAFSEAQEHFANALLIKPNDADLWHEFAAASYYAYDIRSALKGVEKAAQLKPNDPLIHRSATMIYAALGDFNTAKAHFEAFKEKAGEDPSVTQVSGRFEDWKNLYNSGRIQLAAATSDKGPSSPTGGGGAGAKGGSSASGGSSAKGGSSTGSGGSGSGGSMGSAGGGGGGSSSAGGASTGGAGAGGASAGGAAAASGGSGAPSDGAAAGGSGSAPSTAESIIGQDIGQDFAAEGDMSTVGQQPQLTMGTDGSAGAPQTEAATAPAAGTTLPPSGGVGAGTPDAGAGRSAEEQQKQQVIVDCYLLRIAESATTTKGHNILENLAVTLTPGSFATFKGKMSGSGVDTLANASSGNNIAYQEPSAFKPNQPPGTGSSSSGALSNFTNDQATVNFNNVGSMSARVFSAGLTWAGLTYSLNIANAVDNRTEVVSRPSILTFLNQPATFFSGTELVNGFTGQYGGTLVTYPVGITVEVTPQALVDDLLTVTIGIEGSLLTTPEVNLATTVRVQKSRIDTYVKIRLGETLMLGGLYERTEVYSKAGFPGLQDIPVVQYFFSQEQTASDRRSIVFMMTPRSTDAVKSAINRAMTRQDYRPNLEELASRTPNWFATNPNLLTAFRYLVKDPVIYYEFRTGDVLPPSWGWEPPIHEKLALLEGFLYY
jgi:Tfp pilus assembly protein PilF